MKIINHRQIKSFEFSRARKLDPTRIKLSSFFRAQSSNFKIELRLGPTRGSKPYIIKGRGTMGITPLENEKNG